MTIAIQFMYGHAGDSDVNQWETGSDARNLELWGTARKDGNDFGVC